MSNENTLADLKAHESAIRDSLFADDLTDESRAEMIESWMSFEADITDKTNSYCAVLTRFNAEINMLREEEFRIEHRRKMIENAKARFEQRWADIMLEDKDKTKIETGLHVVNFKKNGAVELLVPPSKLPDSCIVERTSRAASLTAVRQMLESGDDDIRGCARFRHTVSVN